MYKAIRPSPLLDTRPAPERPSTTAEYLHPGKREQPTACISNSTPPIHPVQLPRRIDLVLRPLSPNRQPHRVSPPPITSHVLQPPDILLQNPPRVVFDLHLRQLGREGRDGLGGQRADLCEGEDGVSGHDLRGRGGAQGVEALEGFLRVGVSGSWSGGGFADGTRVPLRACPRRS